MKKGKLIVSVSGGKDSTAMCLHLFEQGYTKDDFERVFMDTGWEHPQTYKYLDELEKVIGKITRLKEKIKIRPEHEQYVKHFEDRLGFESPFVRRVILQCYFPSGLRRWCTIDLKLKPLEKYFDSLDYEYINVVGIRKEESLKRSTMEEWEFNDRFDCWVWRPLIDWTEKDVIDIHHRFGLIPNRLYLTGNERVGCYPCIMARKKEIKILEKDRIQFIADLERTVTKLKRERKGEDQPFVSMFNVHRNQMTTPIEEVVKWSKTSRGGKQFELFSTEEPTCVRWGLCGI